MKSLLLLLSLSLFSGTVAPTVNQVLDTSENPYIMVDESSMEYSLIRYRHNAVGSIPADQVVVDEQNADTKAMMEAKYPEFKTSYLFQDRRSIIGFESPELKSIDRLTLRIRFKMYGKIDIFNVNPAVREETFVIKASNLYQPYAYYMLHDQVTGAETKASFVENFTIPYIGKSSNIVALQNRLRTAADLTGSGFGIRNSEPNFEYVIDNPIFGNNYYSISSSCLAQKAFYVVMPCYFDISRVWISVAGIDVNDNPVSDGLDSTGTPLTSDIDGITYNYVDLGASKARAVYFSERSTVTGLLVSGSDVGSGAEDPYLRFGDFDFHKNSFNTLVREYCVSDVGQYVNSTSDRFVVESGQDAVLSFVPEGDFLIRVFYLSSGIAVSQNIVGTDGVENPIDVTPSTTSDYQDLLTDLLGGSWDELGKILGFAIGGLVLVGVIVLLITRFSNRRGKTVVNIINDKKSKK